MQILDLWSSLQRPLALPSHVRREKHSRGSSSGGVNSTDLYREFDLMSKSCPRLHQRVCPFTLPWVLILSISGTCNESTRHETARGPYLACSKCVLSYLCYRKMAWLRPPCPPLTDPSVCHHSSTKSTIFRGLLFLFSMLPAPFCTVNDSAPVALWVINKSCRKWELDLEGKGPWDRKRDQCVF